MKKLILAIVVSLTTAMLLTLGVSAVDFSVSPAATGEMLGDANGDGAVNAMDVLFVKRYAANVQPSVEVGADANCDGRINASDILAMKRHAAEIQNLSELSKDTVKILAVDGVNIKNMAIVAPEGTDPNLHNAAYAAEELRHYLAVTTGYNRSVEYGEASTEHAVYINYDPTIEGAFSDYLTGEAGVLGEEGFTIEIRDGNIYITGGRLRGCMYAVYQLLEDYVGVRFIADDEIYYYSADIINLENGLSVEILPAFEYRYCGGNFNINTDTIPSYAFPRKVNARQLNAYENEKTGYLNGNHFINAHSWAYYRADMWPRPGMEGAMSAEEWNKKCGDLNNSWQPCLSNEDEFDELFQGLLRYSDMLFNDWGRVPIPSQSSMSFSMMDNTHFCTCAACRSLYDRMGIAGALVQYVSRAADMYQEYWPGVKLYIMTYDHTPPTSDMYVSENLVLMYCGTGCNNHIMGSGDCGDGLTVLGGSNKIDEESFPKWCELADEVYFWEYGVNYHYKLAPAPCIFNIYYDIKFMYENGGEGIYYEGTDFCDYNFEHLKGYIASRVMWDPEMSFEELEYIIQEYLYIRYGDGYEAIYDLICTLNDCGDAAPCWITNHDRPWEMYDPATTAANYEKMLSLLEEAKGGARNSAQYKRVEELGLHVNFLGLSATYEDVYVNGDDAAKAQYEARYQWLWQYLTDNNKSVYSNEEYNIPKTCNLDTNPMEQFYVSGYTSK